MASGGTRIRRRSAVAEAVLASGLVGKDFMEGIAKSREFGQYRMSDGSWAQTQQSPLALPLPPQGPTAEQLKAAHSESEAYLHAKCAELSMQLAAAQAAADENFARAAAAHAEVARVHSERDAALSAARKQMEVGIAAAEAGKRTAQEKARGLDRELQKLKDAADEERRKYEQRKEEHELERRQREEWSENAKRKSSEAIKKVKREMQEEMKQAQEAAVEQRRQREVVESRLGHLQRKLQEQEASCSALARQLDEERAHSASLSEKLARATNESAGLLAKDLERQKMKEALESQTQRALDIASCLEHSDKKRAEEKERYTAKLAALEARVRSCETEVGGSIATLLRSSKRASKRTANSVASSSPERARYPPPSPDASSTTTSATKVLTGMNENEAETGTATVPAHAHPAKQEAWRRAAWQEQQQPERASSTVGSDAGSAVSWTLPGPEEVIDLRAQVVALKAKLTAARAEVAAEAEEHNGTRQEVESLTLRVRKLSKELGSAKSHETSEIATLQRQIQEMRRTWHSEEEWHAEQLRVQEMATSLKCARDDLAKRAATIATLKREKDDLEARWRTSANNGNRSDAEAKKLREEGLRKDGQLRALRQELETTKHDLTVSEKAAASAASRAATLARRLADSEAAVAALTASAQAEAEARAQETAELETLRLQTLNPKRGRRTAEEEEEREEGRRGGAEAKADVGCQTSMEEVAMVVPERERERERERGRGGGGGEGTSAAALAAAQKSAEDAKSAVAVAVRESEKARDRAERLQKRIRVLQKQLEDREQAAKKEAKAEEVRWRARVTELEGSLKAVRAQTALDQKSAEEARVAATASAADVMDIMADRDRLDTAYWRLREQLDEKSKELEECRALVHAVEAAAEQIQQTKAQDRAELEDLRAERVRLEGEVQALKRATQQQRPPPKLSFARAFSISCPDNLPPASSPSFNSPNKDGQSKSLRRESTPNVEI